MELAPAPKLGGHVKLWMEWGRSDRTGSSQDPSTEGGVGCGELLQLAALEPANPTFVRKLGPAFLDGSRHVYHQVIALIRDWVCSLSAGLRYLIVDSRSTCPIIAWTVRISIPDRRSFVQ